MNRASAGCMIRLLTSRGLVPAEYRAESLAEAAQSEPYDGVYTLSNTCHVTQVVAIDEHFDRLEQSARLEGIPLLLDRSAVRRALRRMIEESGFGDVRFRITVPHSGYPITLSIEPFHGIPQVTYERGVRCVTVPGVVRANAGSKTTGWMHERKVIADKLAAGVQEAILCNTRGELLEGISSNFYAVLMDAPSVVRTAGSQVLPGIAQRILRKIEEAERGGASSSGNLRFTFDLHPPLISELPHCNESFLTSSSRGIVPIVEIDGRSIGSGLPGVLTGHLMRLYRSWVESHLVEI